MKPNDRGASAILITFAVGFLLLGMAALAIDVGAGFNERRQDQSAADASVMAGGLEASFLTTNADLVDEALLFARQNLDTTYTDAEWQALWEGCSDSARPANFFQMPNPWGGAALDCISRSSSFVRVRIPNQSLDSAFGTFVGVQQLTTSAFAVAKIENAQANSPIIPYGIAGGAGSGELCFGSNPSGTAFPPCTGPSTGTFGSLLSEFFGDFYGAIDCGNPGATEIATGTALGIDHFLGLWANTAGVNPGDPHPGDTYVLNTLVDTNRDACQVSGGLAVAEDGVPLNTVRVDTGFPSNAMEDGLVSENMFVGRRSRLQQDGVNPGGSNPKRPIVARRAGSNETIWDLDNVGPWDYLVANGISSNCSSATYTPALTEAQKAARFNDCIADYASSGSTADIFDLTLDDSPRFAWAPQYWYALPTTGLSWEPVRSYRMVFIAGTWYNCSAGSCAVTFYPDSDVNTELCDVGGGSNCNQLTLRQFSAWVLPDDAVPDEIRNSFPGGQTPFSPTLWR